MVISKAVKKDARAQAGSIYRMNAPRSIGYLFTCRSDGSEVAQGMFCDRWDEVDPKRWDGLLLFEDDTVYDLTDPASYKRLMGA